VDGKRTALPEFRLDRDFAAMQESEVLDDSEAQPGAAHLTRTRPIDTIETFEQTFQVLRRNAVAVVCHQDAIVCS
jgi:hypothetical protein